MEKPGLLGCCALWLGNFFPTFRRNVLLSFSRSWACKSRGGHLKPQFLYCYKYIYFWCKLSFSFIVSCWWKIDFLRKNETSEGFITFRCQFLYTHNNITTKIQWKWIYCSVSNVGIQNSKNMAVSITRSWCCSPSAARHGRQYHRTLLLYISLKFNRDYCNETLPSFPSWNLREGFFFHEISVWSQSSCKLLLKSVTSEFC